MKMQTKGAKKWCAKWKKVNTLLKKNLQRKTTHSISKKMQCTSKCRSSSSLCARMWASIASTPASIARTKRRTLLVRSSGVRGRHIANFKIIEGMNEGPKSVYGTIKTMAY